MSSNIKNKLQNNLTFFEKMRKLRHNAAIYPFIFGIISLFLGLLMIYWERQGVSYKFARFFNIKADNFGSGTSLLTSLVGAIISVLTFSYSTLLVLLNQATSNYSPRVMPNLLSIRGHKVVLGVYVGMIVYNIVLILGFDVLLRPPVLSVVSGILYAIVCIFSFIYFINSVIKEIQPDKIMKDILNNSLDNLHYIKEKFKDFEQRDVVDFEKFNPHFKNIYTSNESGSLTINYKNLLEVCGQIEGDVKVLVKNGDIIFTGMKIFSSEKPLDDNQIRSVMSCLMIDTSDDDINYNYVFGLKRLTEIGLKAMSPGVNDPITATSSLFYITMLLSQRLGMSEVYKVSTRPNGSLYVSINSFENLLYFVMAGFRTYAKSDVYCLMQIHKMFEKLLSCADADERIIIKNEIKVIQSDYRENLSEWDIKKMDQLFNRLLKNN